MALLRMKEIRAMRPEDLDLKMKELSDELMHERGVAAMGGAPASPGKLRALRTNVARIHTVKRELELADERKAPAKKSPKAAKREAARKEKDEESGTKEDSGQVKVKEEKT